MDSNILSVFGPDDSSMEDVERRARAAFPDRRIIVWEGDPQTFAFSFVGADAEAILGHSRLAWSQTSDFWTRAIVHPEDEADAVAFCALATAKGQDHFFRYRARTTSGAVVWLEDYVRVILGERGVPRILRGLMVELAESSAPIRHLYVPERAELEAL